MKAAVWYGRGDVRVEEVPEPPPPAPGDVQIRVNRCGLCGSDVREYREGPILIPTTRPNPLTGRVAPIILGHEFSGEIVALGERVAGLQVGDRVTALPARYCLACAACLSGRYNQCVKAATLGFAADGALAEYVNVPALGVYRLPPQVTWEEGALVEPLVAGVHAVRQVQLRPEDTLAIVGAGMMGVAVLLAARAIGCQRSYVIARGALRQDLASRLGATTVLDPTAGDPIPAVRDLTGGNGVDVAFECGGSADSVPLAMAVVRRGGALGMLGLFKEPYPFDLRRLVTRELRVYGCFAYAGEWPETIALIASGKLAPGPLIAQHIALPDVVAAGLAPLAERKIAGVRVMVEIDS